MFRRVKQDSDTCTCVWPKKGTLVFNFYSVHLHLKCIQCGGGGGRYWTVHTDHTGELPPTPIQSTTTSHTVTHWHVTKWTCWLLLKTTEYQLSCWVGEIVVQTACELHPPVTKPSTSVQVYQTECLVLVPTWNTTALFFLLCENRSDTSEGWKHMGLQRGIGLKKGSETDFPRGVCKRCWPAVWHQIPPLHESQSRITCLFQSRGYN